MILNNERSPNSLQDVYLCAMCTFLFLSCDIYIYRGYLSIERKTVNSIQRFHDLCRYALLYFSIRSLTRRCACFSFFSLSLSLYTSPSQFDHCIFEFDIAESIFPCRFLAFRQIMQPYSSCFSFLDTL